MTIPLFCLAVITLVQQLDDGITMTSQDSVLTSPLTRTMLLLRWLHDEQHIYAYSNSHVHTHTHTHTHTRMQHTHTRTHTHTHARTHTHTYTHTHTHIYTHTRTHTHAHIHTHTHTLHTYCIDTTKVRWALQKPQTLPT